MEKQFVLTAGFLVSLLLELLDERRHARLMGEMLLRWGTAEHEPPGLRAWMQERVADDRYRVDVIGASPGKFLVAITEG